MAEKERPAVGSGGRDPLGGNPVSGHCTPKSARRQVVMLHGKPVMSIRNGVAIRRAHSGEMLRKPAGWSFHIEVLEQLERAHTCHLEIVDLTSGKVYRTPWETFMAFSAALDRGAGRQRFLPLQYWGIDGKAPERQPKVAEPAWVQGSLFDLGERNQQR